MTSLTSSIIKYFYESREDRGDDLDDIEPLLIFLADNQVPNLFDETAIEILSACFLITLIWFYVAVSEASASEPTKSASITCNLFPMMNDCCGSRRDMLLRQRI